MRKFLTTAALLALWIACFDSAALSRADTAPTTKPSGQSAAAPQTGDIDLTFIQRSPLSDPKAMARRLTLKPASVADDYDISQRPFKAYVPKNYDPSTSVGIVVYLGYKDSTATPPLWQPFLEQAHLIFISPVCHTGDHYPNSVPQWQSLGLAFDAVDNLKRQYSIDPKRIYLISTNPSGAQDSFNASDVFTGFMIFYDPLYYARLTLPGGAYYRPQFAPPSADLISRAMHCGFFLISDPTSSAWPLEQLRLTAMKQHGYTHVQLVNLSLMDDLHYPNFKLEWFQNQAIPFLDKASTEAPTRSAPPALTQSPAASPAPPPATSPPTASAPPAGAPAAPPPAPDNPAAHLLSMAKLYIKNNMIDLAKTKLQQIVTDYPADPAAADAKQLLNQLNSQ